MLLLGLALIPVTASAPASSADHAETRVTLRAQNEPVRAVLLRLAHQTGANIAVGEGVSGYVTLELHGVTLAQALRAILEPLGAAIACGKACTTSNLRTPQRAPPPRQVRS